MEDKTYSVSEAVRLVGVESHVLRYWEEELHISIQRNAQGHRLYSKENIRLFRKVKSWKEKGLQLKAIRILLAQTDALCSPDAEGFAGQLEEVFDPQADAQPECNSRTDRPQGINDSVCDIESDSCVCEIVPTAPAEAQDGLERIAAVFRQIVKEAAKEQNEHLEKILVQQLREEAQDVYLQYFQMLQETAAAKAEVQKESVRQNIFRRIWDAICGEGY